MPKLRRPWRVFKSVVFICRFKLTEMHAGTAAIMFYLAGVTGVIATFS